LTLCLLLHQQKPCLHLGTAPSCTARQLISTKHPPKTQPQQRSQRALCVECASCVNHTLSKRLPLRDHFKHAALARPCALNALQRLESSCGLHRRCRRHRQAQLAISIGAPERNICRLQPGTREGLGR
jgi:hypothetical protein